MEFDLIMIALVIALVFLFFWNNIVITIYPGYRGVLYHRFTGTVTSKVYTEGLHLIFPWDKMYLYDIRLHEKTVPVAVLAQSGLTIDVVATVHYKPDPDQLPFLHSRIGPDYETKVIVPVVMSSVREIVGATRAHDIYSTNQQLLQNEILHEVLREGSNDFITFDNIIIRSITLPPQINAAIDAKLAAEQDMLRHDFLIASAKKEAARKVIEAGGIRRYHAEVAASLTKDVLRWRGITATEELSKSDNSKVVVIGSGEDGLPIILGGDR